MAIDELSVHNFRAIQSETLKEIPPVAGIWGRNGCGKSAVLQSIVALKNFAEVGYGPEPVPALNSHGLALGGWDTIFFKGQSPGKQLSIEAKGRAGVRLGLFQLAGTVTIDVPDSSFPGSIRYFPTQRTLTERTYPISDYSTAGLALSPNIMHPYVHWFIHQKLYERQQTGLANELDDVNKWLRGFGLGEISDRPTQGPQATVSGMFTDAATGYGAPIIDGGFGGNSMLSILLEAYSFKNGILLVEEPEMSLHPGAQADLFDLFVTLAEKRGHQVISLVTRSTCCVVSQGTGRTTSARRP